jgi:hypothetical protein
MCAGEGDNQGQVLHSAARDTEYRCSSEQESVETVPQPRSQRRQTRDAHDKHPGQQPTCAGAVRKQPTRHRPSVVAVLPNRSSTSVAM